MADEASESRMEFLWNTHSYINEYIRFSDVKAAVVIAWSSAILGAISEADRGASLNCLSWPWQWLAWLAIGFLVIAFILAVASIIPRTPKAPAGFIYWESILAFSQGEFAKKAVEVSDASMRIELANHLHALASTASKKFSRVVWSIGFAFLGSICAGVVFIVAR